MAKKTVKGKARKGSVAKALVQAVKAVAIPPKKAVKGKKFVYFFGAGKADGDRSMKDTLGGKGSGLAEMTNAGLPVPPGFTISTGVCNIYYDEKGKVPAEIDREIDTNLAKLEKAAGKKLGDVSNPLLVSVRSGAKFSMPGMMDTILNLGLNDATVEGLKAKTGNGRFAYDSYRRFMQMFGNVVMSIPKEKFEHEFEAVKHERGAKTDTDLDESGLQEVVTRYKAVVKRETGKHEQALHVLLEGELSYEITNAILQKNLVGKRIRRGARWITNRRSRGSAPPRDYCGGLRSGFRVARAMRSPTRSWARASWKGLSRFFGLPSAGSWRNTP